MILETERLILRPWEEKDAEDMFEYAKDPAVGPAAGWPPHKSAAESLEIIRRMRTRPQCYAVCLKETGKPVGAAELMLQGNSDLARGEDECELGYWIGKPYWGKGLMPEAAAELIRHGFEELHMQRIWAGYYEGNERSRRVQEKCGFYFQWTTNGVEVPQLKEVRTGHVSLLTKEAWDALQKKGAGEQPETGVNVLDDLAEELLEGPCRVIDCFPERVPADRGSAYFAAERFFLTEERLRPLHEAFALLLIRLNCYHDAAVYMNEKWTKSPDPGHLFETVAGLPKTDFVNVLYPDEKALVTLNGGDLYLSVYGGDEAFRTHLEQLASAAGFFVRPGA